MSDKFITEFVFTPEQVHKNMQNTLRDMDIARRDEILEVKFAYAYTKDYR